MGAEDLELSVAKARTAGAVTIALADNTSTAATMTKKGFDTKTVWDPSNDESQRLNRATHGGLTRVFLKPSIPFSLGLTLPIGKPPFPYPIANGGINRMSIYYPFPLRIDGQQYDACFQIGEFAGEGINGTGVVVLVPLVSGTNATGPGSDFIDKFAGLMPGVTAGDVTVSSLNIRDIVDANGPFYVSGGGNSLVVIMAEPVTISVADMTSIQMSGPMTAPETAISSSVLANLVYKSVPPPAKPPVRVVQPPVDLTVGETHHDKIVEVLKGVGYAVVTFFVVWLAIKFAKSDAGASVMNSIGGGLSWMYRGLTGASARAAQGVRSGVGAAGQGIQSGVSAVGNAASSAAQGIRSGIGAIGVGPKPLRPALPTSADQIAKRAQKEKDLAEGVARRNKVLAQNKTRRNGTFSVENPLLAKKPTPAPAPTAKEQEAAAGVGPLKPAPTKVNPPAALKVAKKQVGEDFSQENPMQKALRKKRAADKEADKTAVPPPKVPKRRNIGPIEEEDEEDRLERRARETSLAPFRPNLKTQYLRKTGAVAGGRRRRRMRTGRRV